MSKLDKEWVELIKMAKQVGIPPKKVRKYLSLNVSSSCFKKLDAYIKVSLRNTIMGFLIVFEHISTPLMKKVANLHSLLRLIE